MAAKSAGPRDARKLQAARPGPTQASRAARQRSPRGGPRPAQPGAGPGRSTRAARDSQGVAVERGSPAQSPLLSSGRDVQDTPPRSPARPGSRGAGGRLGHTAGRSPTQGRPPARRPRPSAAPPPLGGLLRLRLLAGAGRAQPATHLRGRRLAHSLPRPAARRPARAQPPPPSDNRSLAPAAVNFLPRPGGPVRPGPRSSPRRPGSRLRGRRGQQRRTERPGRVCAAGRCASAPAGAVRRPPHPSKAGFTAPAPVQRLPCGFPIWLLKEGVIFFLFFFFFSFYDLKKRKERTASWVSEAPPAARTWTPPGGKRVGSKLGPTGLEASTSAGL